MERMCDHKSVGVILSNEYGELALLDRRRFPIGIAPPAGHVDEHGSLERAATTEVLEEVGVFIAASSLRQTLIQNRRVANTCRRDGGDYHDWTVYKARVPGAKLLPNPDETRGALWYDRGGLAELAMRTRLQRVGRISPDDWQLHPGLEPVWLDFLTELGYIES